MYEKYVKILKDHSLKITQPRLEILKYLDQHHAHPNVEEIYSTLKKKHPSLSRTTVYNSLETLMNNKIVHSLTVSGTELRYDIEENLHHHFICTRCGAIIDIAIACPNMGRTLKAGHRVEEVQGYFKGTCKKCLTKEKEHHDNG